MSAMWQDLRYAVRTLLKSRGFTIVAVLTLALGIGATTAVFSVIDAALLKPLPYPEADRIVQLKRTFPGGVGTSISIPKFVVWREQTQVFEDVAAYDFGGPGVNLTSGDRPEQLKAIHVSEGYFRVFRAPLVSGRTFTAEEDRPKGPNVVVISEGLWRRAFGGDPHIFSKIISLGNEPYQVIGIIGRTFWTDPAVDAWLALQADPNSTNQGHYLMVAARLRPGATVESSTAAMKVAAEEFWRKFPKEMDAKESAATQPLLNNMVGDVRPMLLLLSCAVVFVLLIACANVANLLLTRATLRRREIAVRSALGAGHGRIVRQLLTESVLLSLAGGTAGLFLGHAGLRALLAINPGNIPRIGERGSSVTLDWRLLLFALAVSILTGALFELIPALSVSRTDLSASLKESASRSGTGLHQGRTRSVLVIVELALALVLLAGAGLFIRTLTALTRVNPGFDGHNVLTMEMSLNGTHFENTTTVAQLVRDAEQRMENLPGVTAVAMTCGMPPEGHIDLPFADEGNPPTSDPWTGDVQWRSASPRYFEVLQVPLRRGRLFTDRDDGGAAGVVIINEAMAKRFWQNKDPVGDRIQIGAPGSEFAEPARQIVGVVADMKEAGLNHDPVPVMYVPTAQMTSGINALLNRVIPVDWLVRTKGDPYSMSAAVQQELRIASGGLPVAHVRSMDQVLADSTARTKFNALLLSIFAGIALLLASIGIYGLMAYSVEQRTQEIGIRLTLGAAPHQVRNMVVMESMRLVLFGVLAGTAVSLALARVIRSQIYGVKAWDPVVFTLMVLLLGTIALLAAYVPARRATRIDPLDALRYE